ncbi:TetR family transcriptional regulator [Mycobacterium sp. 852013-50091_SCH5140682]|uniref:TetR/AcrR family transcriptional regulator n=1 Tax=Mycobacterium sp. 852013-50091_SCH5140682 TaxID=1834109 RepID=UPI0012EACC24|nr:TetR family transcriptional regulator [Mycobacterium sp. 852013-50091_SCH5140682]
MRLALREAALTVAAEFGVRGVNHRRIASTASVAIGSVSYHYESIDELIFEAFAEWVRRQTDRFTPAFEAASDEDSLVRAVLNHLHIMYGNPRDRILLFELYAQSVRDPVYHGLVENWSVTARAAIERLYSAQTAQQLEAVWEGIGVQLVMGGSISAPEQAEPFIRLVLDQESAPAKAGRRAASRRKTTARLS